MEHHSKWINIIHRFDRDLMRFKEIGFEGIEDENIWEVNDAIYVEEQRRIYILGASEDEAALERVCSDGIWFIEIDDQTLEWKRFKLNMPHCSNGPFPDYSAVFGCNHLLFLFFHQRRELWIFDLLFNKRWKCSQSVGVEAGEFSKLCLDRCNVLHSISFDIDCPVHTKMSLDKWIKNEFREFEYAMHADLVCGFLKRFHVPLSVKTLVFNYFVSAV